MSDFGSEELRMNPIRNFRISELFRYQNFSDRITGFSDRDVDIFENSGPCPIRKPEIFSVIRSEISESLKSD